MPDRSSLEYPVMAVNDMPCHVLTQCLMVKADTSSPGIRNLRQLCLILCMDVKKLGYYLQTDKVKYYHIIPANS